MSRPPQIVAMGGGGFSMEPENPLLDDYVLGLARGGRTTVERPRVCFVPTASGDAEGYALRFFRAFAERAQPSVLELFRRGVGDLRAFLLEQDVVYVGGGNTANLLAVWRAHGLGLALREAWQAGVVLAGLSAGGLCWFEAGVTDSFGPLAPLTGGLGFLEGSFCPHLDSDVARAPTFERLVAAGRLPGGLGADDGCAIHFVGRERHAVVSSRREAGAVQLERRADGAVARTPLAARFLGESVA